MSGKSINIYPSESPGHWLKAWMVFVLRKCVRERISTVLSDK